MISTAHVFSSSSYPSHCIGEKRRCEELKVIVTLKLIYACLDQIFLDA